MTDILFDTQERAPLFADLEDLPEQFPLSDYGIHMHLKAIHRIDHEAERLKKQQAHEDAWFAERFRRLEEARSLHEVESFRTLKEIGEKSCATPYGTAFIRKSTTTVWPEDGVVIEWVKAQPAEVRIQLLRTKESPDKAAIKDYMKSSGSIVPGYETREAEAMSIRKAS